MQLKAIVLSAVVAMVMLSPVIEANSSGKHYSSGGCGCHSSGSTVTISENFPSSYTAGQTYSIQLSVSSSISGTNGGFNVEVDKGAFSTGGSSSVKVSGKSITHSNAANRAWSFDWTAPSAGSGTVNVDIAGMTANGAYGNSGDAWSTMSLTITETVVVTNNPPSVSNVQITPSMATSLDDLMLAYTYSDQDGDLETGTSIHWFKNGGHQSQFNNQLTISKTHTTRNDDWWAKVTPSDGEDFGTETQSNIVTVFNAPPTIASAVLTPSTPTNDDDLSASVTSPNDNDGDALSYEYRWYLDGSLQHGLDNFTIVPSYTTRSGDSWEVEIRAYDGEDYSSWVRSNSISISDQTSNSAPTVDSISISPSAPTTSDSLTASSTSSDADMDAIVQTEYRWSKNGLLTTFSSSVLDASVTSKNDIWSVEIRVNDGTDWSAWTPSSTIQILNTRPHLDAASISATEASTDQDITVNASMSDVDGDTLTALIVWYLDGTEQPAYNNLAMLPFSATTKGDTWTAVVQADDGEETSSQSETVSVSIINTEPQLSIVLNEGVTSQDDLSLEAMITDLDEDETEITSITWFRNGFREGSLDNATVVPSSYLGPGQEWSVEVVASDDESSVVSTSSIIVENAPPIAQITVLTESLYAGERVVLSALASTDADNSIVHYKWSWASGGASGLETSLLMPLSGSLDVSLVVTDESGSTNSTSMTLESIPALTCPNLVHTVSGNDVNLDWTWTSSVQASFEITRNGVVVGKTNTTSFTDSPNLIGTSDYQLQTILDDRILEAPCQSPSVAVVIESSSVELEQGPSSVAGLGLGLVYAIIGILLFTSSMLRRSD
jgi:hypothetical protein